MTMEYEYAICRILGNELPPRDKPGVRLQIFESILEKEHARKDARRVWILNRILEPSLAQHLKERISRVGDLYVEIEIDWQAYLMARTRAEKLTVLVGINHARNEAFRASREFAKFVIVLDGDCYFNEVGWEALRNDVSRDQQLNMLRKYYAIPTIRLHSGLTENSVLDSETDECMLVLRRDADQLFSESIPFGEDDKVEFLLRLGLYMKGISWFPKQSEGPCVLAGRVLHLTSGADELEKDHYLRWLIRKDSLDLLLHRADNIAAALAWKNGMRLLWFRIALRLCIDQVRMPLGTFYRSAKYGVKRFLGLIILTGNGS